MSKIFGDEFKSEIRNLKKLDTNLLKCKAKIEEVIYIIENKDRFKDKEPTLKEALQAVISLSTTVENLLDTIKDFEKTYDKMSPWVKKKVENNNQFRKDLNRVRKVRIGADKLVKEYNTILKQLGNRYRTEVLKRV